ncbi:MAG: hypothetical protein HC906_02595 [Bacteroidales bacterium]|nr:hypothetical protein [Bacteroidales bacterium]
MVVKEYNKRYLFGCCSISSTNPAEGIAVYQYLKLAGHVHQTIQVNTKPGFECVSPLGIETVNEKNLPSVLLRYIQFGSKVCGYPALDKEFKSIDFLMLLDADDFDKIMLEKLAR